MTNTVNVANLLLPIINKADKAPALPLGMLSEDLRAKVDAVTPCEGGFHRLLTWFEGFLYLHGIRITLAFLSTVAARDLCTQFVGALYSPAFIDASPATKLKYARRFLTLMAELGVSLPYGPDDISLESIPEGDIERFMCQSFDRERLWLLQGWWVVNRRSVYTHLPLFPIYARFGRQFTDKLYKSAVGWFQGRTAVHVHGLKEFAEYIGKTQSIQPEDLADPLKSTRFWREFFVAFVSESHGAGTDIITIQTGWSGSFMPFVEGCLVPTGLFTIPLGGFPKNKSPKLSGTKRKITFKDGLAFKSNLLTDIPLEITDAQAIKIIFFEIQADANHIRKWADAECDKIEKNLDSRTTNSKSGKVCLIGRDREEPGAMSYASLARTDPESKLHIAATFEHYGFIPSEDERFPFGNNSSFYRSEIALQLGLPTTWTIIPPLAVLVSEHPCITPSFLEGFELFDLKGRLIGLRETDGGWRLVGYKRRKGKNLAEQNILLNDKSYRALCLLIKQTQPLRDYLLSVHDSDFRFLLLTCGQGFAAPKRVTKLATYTSDPRGLAKIAAGLQSTCQLDASDAERLAKSFSLRSLRASMGVLVYIRTQSVAAMTEALGQSNSRHELLDYYLPTPIQIFFHERWIRQFQTSLLASALRDSPFLHEATGMSPEDLELFLANHALKPIADNPSLKAPVSNANKGSVLFGLDVGVFQALLSLEKAVKEAVDQGKKPGPKATHFCTLTRLMSEYIESPASGRADLQVQLRAAKQGADANEMAEVVCD